MKRQTLEDGQTGPVQFSSDGDRLNPMYNVINVKFSENSHKPQLATVGTYSAMQVSLCVRMSTIVSVVKSFASVNHAVVRRLSEHFACSMGVKLLLGVLV